MKVTVRIPSEPMYATRTLRFVVESLTFLFGGTTTYQTHGSWLDDNWEVVYNRVWNVESYTSNNDHAEVGWEVYRIAEEAKAVLLEDTVMYTVGEEAYFA